MDQYFTIYSDKNGKVETTIDNNFSEDGINCLEMEIGGIRFRGSSFDDFELLEPDNYTKKQLERFTFNKLPVFQTDRFAYQLCNCNLEVHIPQKIINPEKEIETDAIMNMRLQLGKPMLNGGLNKLIANFVLKLGDKKFTSKCDDFETALKQLQKEILPGFRFKNCFSCHYSDYSPVGNGFFGSMMCFRENKGAYLTAAVKEDFFKLAGQGFIAVQESYCCDQFAPREKDTGYRGWPFD